MLFQVGMIVDVPAGFDPDEFERMKAAEKAYSQELQETGEWRHIWRVAGKYVNTSIFDVQSNERLHEILTGLPLFPFLTLTVTPLCRHPSSIREDDS
jgi:muconolactone D-isomerase